MAEAVPKLRLVDPPSPPSPLQLGGDQATTDDLQHDLEACVAEGGDVVPRATRIWLGLAYEVGGSWGSRPSRMRWVAPGAADPRV